jgi:hypothetical protein
MLKECLSIDITFNHLNFRRTIPLINRMKNYIQAAYIYTPFSIYILTFFLGTMSACRYSVLSYGIRIIYNV